MLKAIILEQDKVCLEHLNTGFKKYPDLLHVIAVFTKIEEGIKTIQCDAPDVIFLSADLLNTNNINFSEILRSSNARYILLSENPKYAFKAHKIGAFYFIKKPINPVELDQVLNRLSKIQHSIQINSKQALQSKRLVLPAASSLVFLNHQDIYCLESEGRNTVVHLSNTNTPFKSTLSLKECEARLRGSALIRIHRSYIINLWHIKKYSRGRDAYIVLDNGKRYDVGKNYKSNLNRAIELFLK